MDTVERLVDGFNLFFSMTILLNKYDLTIMNLDQWEERAPTDEELAEVEDENLRKALKNQKFWAIKKEPKRSSRSIKHSFNFAVRPKKEKIFLEQNSKHRWTEFVVDLMKLSLVPRETEPFTWLCNFTCFFNDYLFDYAGKNETDHSTGVSFDQFLYSKILPSIDWRRCNNYEEIKPKKEWCVAWKRIMANSDIRINFTDINKNNVRFRNRKQRSKSYLQDIETLVDWFSLKIEFSKCEKTKQELIKLQYVPFQVKKDTSHLFDVTMCYFPTLVTATRAWHDCLKFFGKI